MSMKRKSFICKYFDQSFKIFVEQVFSEYQLSQSIFNRPLVNIQCFYHLPKLKVKTLKLSVIKNLLNLKPKSKLVKL